MTNFPQNSSTDQLNNAASSTSALPGVSTVQQLDTLVLNAKLVSADATDSRSRPFNLLRSQLIKILAQDGGRLIGITSVAPRAGKSFVISNLAMSIGQLSNKRVFLVDLDLRRGSIADLFGIEAKPGIADYLSGQPVALRDIGRQIGESNVVVYPALPQHQSSVELLVGERFDALIDSARALPQDSIVLFDLPPVFANDDAILVANKLDGMLIVVEQGVTTKKQLQSAIQLLQPTPILGTVFNRSDGGFGDPYGYGGKYDKYYSR